MLVRVKIVLILGVAGLLSLPLKASKLEQGFEALSMYDYFKAKKIFYQIQNKKGDAYTAYGLSVIYSRNDNPFSNIDSAGKYILRSYHTFLSDQESLTLSGFTINQKSILNLADSIAHSFFNKIKQVHTESAYEYFLMNYYLADRALLNEVVRLRDELEYNKLLMANKSEVTIKYLITHPQSEFYKDAKMLREHQLYEETTKLKQPEDYIRFIRLYPTNVMVNLALENLYMAYVQAKDAKGLSFFVRTYPQAYQTLEAWKLLFSLSVKDFSFTELERFCEKYPEFPLKNSIHYELELNKLVIYPYNQKDNIGFIDEKGKFVIKPMYDGATDFHEGLAVVSKNDSVYFINKKNKNPFGLVFKDALVFRNGIAPVKINHQWFFINRQGQTISGAFDEINELRDQVYVVKIGDKYGALDQFGKVIIEPKFSKLGDFKNGYAYFSEKGLYGFVSKEGKIHRPEFEWISDFNKERIAVFQQNNKYGLINAYGEVLLTPTYDLILKTDSSVFVIVAAGEYGFFSSSGCFIHSVQYNFQKEKPADYYIKGNLFRLIKNEEQAFADENGKLIVNYGAYQEINFPSDQLMRVKQKNKYGYLDKKLGTAILFKYFSATDFSEGLAMVKYKDLNIIINTYGAEIFSSGGEIERLSKHYYIINDESRSVINQEGDLIYSDLEQVQQVNDSVYILTLNNGEIKLLVD